MSEHPVLIVGAGPTGLVLAIELARRGVPCHLVDRRPEPLGRDRVRATVGDQIDGHDYPRCGAWPTPTSPAGAGRGIAPPWRSDRRS